MAGWIKLHRSILQWEWYGDSNVFLVFMDLLLNATHKKTRYRGYDLNPGDVVYGHDATSKRIGISIQCVRTAISKLKKTNEITIISTSKFSIVSITNWAMWQSDQQATNKQITSKQQASNSIQEGKEGKEGKEIIQTRFDHFWELFPRQRRGNKEKARQAYLKALNENRASEAEILHGVQTYANSEEVARGFAKGAAAWLNDDRWANDYSPPKTGPDSAIGVYQELMDEYDQEGR